jgi:hypothetical protein
MARTRLAIIEFVHRREQKNDRQGFTHGEHEEGGQWDAAQAAASTTRGGRLDAFKRAAKAYWQQHPARIGLEIATPALSSYAAKHPMQYLGISAAAGAVLMLARPWRMVSVGGLLLALVKSPQLASVVMAAMSAPEEDESGA